MNVDRPHSRPGLFEATTALVLRPWVALAESVASLSGPFEELRSRNGGGFDSWVRFLLNAALAGDRVAADAVQQHILLERRNRLRDDVSVGHTDLASVYIGAHKREYEAFRRQHYPWEIPQAPQGIVWHPSAIPSDASLISAHLLPVLEPHGFRRKTDRGSWRCAVAIEGASVEIAFDLRSLSPVVSPHLEIPAIEFGVGLTTLFAFSAVQLPRRHPIALVAGLQALSHDLALVLPHALSTLSQSIPLMQKQSWLASPGGV